MKKIIYLSSFVLSILFLSCTNEDTPDKYSKAKSISFATSINPLSRIPGLEKAPTASSTNFDASDAISVLSNIPTRVHYSKECSSIPETCQVL